MKSTSSMRGRGFPRPVALSGTARAARSLLRRVAGAKRIEAVLKPEVASAWRVEVLGKIGKIRPAKARDEQDGVPFDAPLRF